MPSKDSLIQKAKQQMELIPSSELPDGIFAREEEQLVQEFTAERLFAQRPETYQMVVSLSAEGLGQIRIGKLLKVSPNTVRAVQEREGISIDIEKKNLARLCHRGASLAFEGVIEDLNDPTKREKIGARDKAVIGAVMVDKGQLLAGEATSRLELAEIKAPEHDDFVKYLEEMKRANVVEMRSGGEISGQKGSAAGSPGGVDGAVLGGTGSTGVDSQSEGEAT